MPEHHRKDEDFYSDNEHEENHIDEKWLISYSDMMTLLFGFFVMMYVLSTSNKVKMEEALQQISKEGFNSEKVEKKTDDPKSVTTIMEKTAPAADDILIELKKKEEKNRKELEHSLIQAKADVTKNEQELKVALEKIKKMEESQAVVSSDKTNQEKKLKEYENNLKLAEVKSKELAKENAMLKQKIDDTPKIKDDDHFMMVFVRWETEKHDIDMTIEDPMGNIFNYKKRTIANAPGEFVVDTTQGPGVESWVTNKTVQGIYKVTFKFYNQYGNKKDAVIKPSIFNNLKVEELPEITLNFTQKKEKTVLIEVAKDGQFTVVQ
jgi:flagellar motor protein MotB